MIITNQQSIKKKQDGIALLVLVIALALTISVYYFSNISITKIQADKLQETQLALKQAKQVILAYATTRADLEPPTVLSPQPGRFGYLPCPSNDNPEGISDGTCELKKWNTLGWFPWRSLGVSPIKDGNGSCLLYAVSGDYKVAPTTDMLNEDSNGMFQVVDETGAPVPGGTPQDRVVAIIFSAGDALAGQDRDYLDGTQCGDDDDNYSAYLESLEVSPGDVVNNSAVVTGTADEVYRVVQAATATNKAVINDQFITISRDEIWDAIRARDDFNDKMSNLTEALAVCMSDYATANTKNRLPWPAPMDLADYRLDNNYDDNADATPGYAGRFPYIVADSNDDIDITGADAALFTEAGCDTLVLPSNGTTVDLLGAADDEYNNFWKNWKDHFFYVVSQGYAPATTVVNLTTTCPGNCITVDTVPMAAAVIFSGSSLGQARTGPVGPDINNKDEIARYLENDNQAEFPDGTGDGAYKTGSNDIMFCIDKDLGVAAC